VTRSTEIAVPIRPPWKLPIVLAALACTLAGYLAINYALVEKSHVVPHTFGAYGLIWVLLGLYVLEHRARRRFFRFAVWLTLIALLAVLCFVHLDDAVAEAGSQLHWAVGLNGLAGLIVTLHLFWLGRSRPISA
jgi:membrane associated rhomboid family serine protease